MIRIAEQAEEIFAGYGLTLNKTKCALIGDTLEDIRVDGMRCINSITAGFKTLGVTIGSRESKAAYLARKIEKAAPPVRALATLAPEASMQLIRYVYNHKGDYIHKTMESTAQLDTIFEIFDDGIDEALLAMGIAHIDPAELRLLRQLPLEMGGLGLPTLGGDQGTRQRLITACRAWNHIDAHAKHLQGVFNQLFSTPEMTALYAHCRQRATDNRGAEEEDERPADMGVPHEGRAGGDGSNPPIVEQSPIGRTPSFLLYGSPQCNMCGNRVPDTELTEHMSTCMPAQIAVDHQEEQLAVSPPPVQIDIRSTQRKTKEAVETTQTRTQQAFIEVLQSNPRRCVHAIQLRSQAYKGSGKLISNSYRQTEHKVVPDQVYLAAVSQRVLCDAFSVGGHPATEEVLRNGPRLHCKCQLELENAEDIRLFPGHGTSCKRIGQTINRHNNVRDILHAHLRNKVREENGRVTVEPRAVVDGVREAWGPDLAFETRGVTKHIDVLIVDPAAERYQHGDNHPGKVAGGAAMQGEQRKWQRYIGSHYEETLVPFVLESTGRFGPEAERFVREYGGSASSQAALKKRISVALAIWEGKRRVAMLKNMLTEGEFRVHRGIILAARHPVQG
jgi:hypothetical protein